MHHDFYLTPSTGCCPLGSPSLAGLSKFSKGRKRCFEGSDLEAMDITSAKFYWPEVVNGRMGCWAGSLSHIWAMILVRSPVYCVIL